MPSDEIDDDVEKLSAKFHDIYQAEAHRQGDARHKDAYADLPENIKEFDRVLAREVIRMMAQARLEGVNAAIVAAKQVPFRAHSTRIKSDGLDRAAYPR